MRHLPLILVLLVTVLVFGQVISHDFLSWDDDVFLTQNPHTQPPTFETLQSYWTAPYAHLYAPVTYSAWWLLARTFGVAQGGAWVVPPMVFHTASLLAHLLAVCVAYALLLALVESPWAAAAGALLYAIHPLQVESVAWASELKDLLSGLFGLAAVWLYVKSRSQSSVGHGLAPRQPLEERASARALQSDSLGLYLLATLCFVLAILSKPNVVMLPLLALVVEWLIVRRPTPSPSLKGGGQRGLLWILPWLLIAGLQVLFTRHVQPPAPDLALPLWQRVFVAGDSLAFYLGKLFLPVNLTADYGRMPALVAASGWGKLTWLLPAALLAPAIVLRKRSRWALPGLLWFSLALLPVLGLLPFDFQQYSTVADHYAYLALFGAALALAGLCLHLRGLTSRLPAILLVVLYVLLAAQSGLQTMTWTNNLAFWQQTLEVNAQSFLAHNNLGATYQMQGRPYEAVRHFELALELHPQDPDTTINLGLLKAQLRDLASARDLLERGLQLRPGDPKALMMLGVVALWQKDYDTAVSRLQATLESAPKNLLTRYYLALAIAGQGRKAEARAQLEEILRQAPDMDLARKALATLQ